MQVSPLGVLGPLLHRVGGSEIRNSLKDCSDGLILHTSDTHLNIYAHSIARSASWLPITLILGTWTGTVFILQVSGLELRDTFLPVCPTENVHQPTGYAYCHRTGNIA